MLSRRPEHEHKLLYAFNNNKNNHKNEDDDAWDTTLISAQLALPQKDERHVHLKGKPLLILTPIINAAFKHIFVAHDPSDDQFIILNWSNDSKETDGNNLTLKGPGSRRQKMMSHDMKVNRATVKVPLQSKPGFYLCLCLNVWASLCRTVSRLFSHSLLYV